ncbi:hypothetical protein [Parachryseolinea silvisoli]|jgi:hypothetical protein|uniref:hypothetical protein n=1 Tax=Parachryseolinea silvisoli TaxID=2873601 RepID=UPI0022657E60|nr:hypothetical protein [Parachryseolinea silvisoli]MCD9015147.1 hypothetical protein [Parachryseolinea silvisoli]
MKIENRDIFEQIGTIFYAIAAEQHVKPLEVAELKMLISRDWLPRNHEKTKSVVSDETHFILTTLDALQGAETTARYAFDQFVHFYKLHSELFSVDLAQRIVATATDITRIFQADSPLENKSLVALKALILPENVRMHQDQVG